VGRERGRMFVIVIVDLSERTGESRRGKENISE
jgi:hypothetical protein